MNPHPHHPGHAHAHAHVNAHDTAPAPAHDHEDGLAEVLDLDAKVLGSYLDDLTGWVAEQITQAPSTVVDVGAGTGTGSLALARRFDTATVVAVDRSAAMLERVRTAAQGQGLGDRVRTMEADVDVAWPETGGADLVWASSVLHEVADPGRLLRDVRAALNPGGLLVVIEMDALPRFLPDDLGWGRPGLEVRCHEALGRAGWNAHPDWSAHLTQAGLPVVAQRGFAVEAIPGTPSSGRYARAWLGRVRTALEGQLAPDDLGSLDRLLADETPDSLLRRGDVTVRSSRTAWAARRH